MLTEMELTAIALDLLSDITGFSIFAETKKFEFRPGRCFRGLTLMKSIVNTSYTKVPCWRRWHVKSQRMERASTIR